MFFFFYKFQFNYHTHHNRYFHVRRLGYEAGGRFPADITGKCSNNGGIESGSVFVTTDSQAALECSKYSSHAIPGVFNCRFSNPVGNGATKRKKKKPTTFIPQPILGLTANHANESDADAGSTGTGSNNGLMSVPFWRRPLPRSHTGGSSENEGSAGSRVNIHQKLQEKKQKQLAELKIIEEEIKQGKLGGPTTNILELGDDGRGGSLMRQPIPRVKKHINVEPMEWRSNSPEMVAAAAQNVYNDLNVLSSSNIDDVNNLNKYTSNYDPLYNSFGLNGINIPALATGLDTTATVRNMSPISSAHVSATESSLTRSVMPRTKMHLNMLRNPFAETYRGNYPNVYAASGNGNRPPSISPRNTANSPNRGVVVSATAGAHYDHHADFCLEVNHPRQISGTYSGCVVPSGIENLPFPYNVIPPPKSKLDSRLTPTAPIVNANKTIVNAGSNNPPPVIQNRLQRQIQRAKTPEILLAPHYLDNSRVYYDWVARDPISNRMHQQQQQHQQDRHQICSSGDENLDEHYDDGHGRIPSDIDSQVSFYILIVRAEHEYFQIYSKPTSMIARKLTEYKYLKVLLVLEYL